MDAKYTPGPYVVRQTHGLTACLQITTETAQRDGYADYLATVNEGAPNYHSNAALFAAAPLMLEVLEAVERLPYKLCQPVRTVDIPLDLHKRITAAIRAAKGEA